MRKITLVLLLTSISFILLTPRLTHAEYNPITGRFLQRDPIKYVDGMNLYEYVNSRPTYFVDSFGLTSVAPVILESELGAYGHYIAGEGKPAALAPWLLDILANQGGFFEMKLKILSEMSTLFPKCDRKPRMKVHTIVKIRKGLLTGPSYSIKRSNKRIIILHSIQ